MVAWATLDQGLAQARVADRPDAVMAGGAGPEAVVGVGGGRGPSVGQSSTSQPPVPVRDTCDVVAGDRLRAAGGGGGPPQVDGGRPRACAVKRPGRVRQEVHRGGAGLVRGISRSVEVDGRHPVVARDAPGEARVAVAGVRAPGIAHQSRPGITPVRRHFDQVPGDAAPAIRTRLIPLQLDRRGAVGHRREVARLPGNPGARLSGDVSHRHVEAERAIAGQIPKRVGAAVVVEHPNRVEAVDGAGQKQEHIAGGHFDLGHGLDVERVALEEGYLEVAGRRDEILIEVFVEDDDDFVAVDLRVADYRAPGVHVDLENAPQRGIPLPRLFCTTFEGI